MTIEDMLKHHPPAIKAGNKRIVRPIQKQHLTTPYSTPTEEQIALVGQPTLVDKTLLQVNRKLNQESTKLTKVDAKLNKTKDSQFDHHGKTKSKAKVRRGNMVIQQPESSRMNYH